MKHSLHLYGTLGPACATKEKIRTMFLSGMTGMRLNLSHSNLDDCKDCLKDIRYFCSGWYRILLHRGEHLGYDHEWFLCTQTGHGDSFLDGGKFWQRNGISEITSCYNNFISERQERRQIFYTF